MRRFCLHHDACQIVLRSPIVYVMTPNVTGTFENFVQLPLYTVKVFSKATNKELRGFRVPWCLYRVGQPVMVP